MSCILSDFIVVNYCASVFITRHLVRVDVLNDATARALNLSGSSLLRSVCIFCVAEYM